MHVGLFIPCYIDQFYPQVGIATLQLLEKLGCKVSYPLAQTCCGQPLANAGLEADAQPIYEHFVKTFEGFDYIVCPSGSCSYHVRHHYGALEQTETVQNIRNRTLELSEFLVEVLRIDTLEVAFPHKVGIHQSCHGLRGLRLGRSSELHQADFSNYKYLLGLVDGIEIVELERTDECCGFGGTFAVNEPAVSIKMGKDRIADHLRQAATVITAGDMSCLMHLEGIIEREQLPIKVKHIVEILNGTTL